MVVAFYVLSMGLEVSAKPDPIEIVLSLGWAKFVSINFVQLTVFEDQAWPDIREGYWLGLVRHPFLNGTPAANS